MQDHDIGTVVRDMREAIEGEEEADKSTTEWTKILCPVPAIGHMLLAGFGFAIGRPVSIIKYYLLYVLDALGVESELWQTLILIGPGIVKMLFVLFAGKVIDTWGRRPKFLASFAGMIVALVLISIPFLVVVGVSVYLQLSPLARDRGHG